MTVPGDELALAASAPSPVNVTADFVSSAPIDTLDIIVNGSVAQTVRATDPGRASFRGPKSPYLGDDYAFAQTTPVYVVRGGERYVSSEDVKFLADTVREIWTRVEKGRWRSDAERAAFRTAVDRALAVYEQRPAEAK